MTRLAVLGTLILLTAASPAAGQSLSFPEGPVRLVDRRQGDFTTTGQVTVAFARDDVRGSITHAPARAGHVSAAELATRSGRYRNLTLIADGGQAATTIAQVLRAAPDGTTRRCTDATGERFASLADGPADRLALTLPPGALRTRCGGPTGADLAGALPTLRLPGDVLPHGDRTIDLRAQRSFAAGAASGTVRSSVVVRLIGVRSAGEEAGGSRAESLLSGFRTVRLERSDGVVALELAVPADGAGCEDLDLCGATVTQELSLTGARGRGAVRLGRRSATGYLASADVKTRTTLRRPDGSRCADALAATPLSLELHPVRGGRVRTALTLLGQTAIGLTGCSSPAPADVGLPRRLAVGSVARSALERDSITLRLRGAGAFAGPLGRGRAAGELVVALRRSGGAR